MKQIAFVFILFFSTLIFGQEISPPDFIPGSPNASSLGEYGQVPVGIFNGTPQLAVPLYNIKIKNFEMPLSLSYSSNGIRVNEMASNVGLGWDLQAGGVISRSLNDEKDEYRVDLPNYPFGSEDMNIFLQGVVYADQQDTQPDIFSFNFNGYSGRFYLGEQLTPILIDPSPLKIERLSSTSFRITDPQGIIYLFGGTNAIENTWTRTYGFGTGEDNIPTEEVNMAYYLTKIILIGGKEINLSYNSSNVIYDGGITQRVTATRVRDIYQNGGYPYYNPATHDLPLYFKTYSELSYLSDITWENGKIHFDYAPRFPGISDPNFLRVDEMEVLDIDNTTIKKIKFDYQIYDTLSDFNNQDNLGIDETKYKRIFLDAITFFPDQPSGENEYTFEYYSPDQLPPRLSYAQDYWGYFNGKINPDLVPKNMPYDLYPNQQIAGLFGNVGGDRNPNGSFGVKGLLKKITYPTGGYNEMVYEPHSYWGTEIVYQNDPQQIALNPYTIEGDMREEAEYTTETIPFRQASPVYHSAGYGTCWQNGWPDHKVKASISVRVADYGSNDFVMDPLNTFYSVPSGCDPLECASKNYHGDIVTTANNGYPQFYIELKEGRRYRFKVELSFHCIDGNFGMTYYDQNYTEVQKNIEVGGLRLKSVVSNDGIDTEVKNYQYGDLAHPEQSSGEFAELRPSISIFNSYQVEIVNGVPQDNETTAFTLGANTLDPIYSLQGYHINYKNVIEELGDSFAGGGVMHQFNVVYDSIPEIIGNHIPGTPYTNNFGNAKEETTTWFKKDENGQFKNVKKVVTGYNYEDERKDSFINGFTATVSRRTTTPYLWYEFNLNKYRLKSHWLYQDSQIVTDYDQDGNPKAVTTTQYYYDNPDHLQLTRLVTTRSGDDKTLITKTDYPHDRPTDSYMDDLIADNRITEPVRVRTYEDKGSGEELLSTQKTVYDDFSGLYLPKAIQTAKGGDPLQNRLVYSSYDGYGNLREVSRPDGAKTVYVMGYDFTLPVAKLENVSLSEINQSWLTPIYNATNDSALVTALTNLRTNITNLNKTALVTTLTYKPLVGVHTVTDPKGYKMIYEYDDFGRLKYVKDMDNNVLSENQYHYIND